MSEVNGTAAKWREWIDAHRAARQALLEVPVRDAKRDDELAHRTTSLLIKKAWHSSMFPVDLDREVDRGIAEALNARSAMRLDSDADYYAAINHLLDAIGRRIHQREWRLESNDRRTFVADLNSGLREAYTRLSESRQALTDAEKRHSELTDDLASVEKERPKASHSSIKALTAEIEHSEADCQRFENALADMVNDGSAYSLAQNELAEAQQRLDDLEADAALGDANKDAQRAAANAIAAARKKSETAQQDAARQTSARRGLERRLEATLALIEELTTIKSEVARHVYESEMAAAESALLKYLSQDTIQPLMDRLNDARDNLNAVAVEGTHYQSATIEIQLPGLYGPQQDACPDTITI